MESQGVFIAVEGIDGVGKGTQARQLLARITDQTRVAELMMFPRYGEAACADVERYLRGEFGDPDAVDAKTASRFYAKDRLDAAPDIRKKLADGITVIADRYVDSNAGHQGGKLPPEEREPFLAWLYALEYEEHKIPKPDLVIILYADEDVSRGLLERRAQQVESPEGKDGGHEKNHGHLRRASDTYLWLAHQDPDRYRLINCSPEGAMLSVEEIHDRIWEQVAPILEGAK
jgi:dTMP kinase